MRAGTPIICPNCNGTGTSQPELLQLSIRGIACLHCHGDGRIMQWWKCEKCGGFIQEEDDYADLLICGKCRNFEMEADDAMRHAEDHI